MVWTLPASVAFKNRPWRTGVAGTLWNGEVGVVGGSKLEWRWAPLRSLTSLGFAADWRATGPDTDLGGRVLARPGGRLVLDQVSGSANGSLLRALAPNLAFTCSLVMQIELRRMAVGGGARAIEGDVATDAGTCAPKAAGAPAPVPALYLSAEHIGTTTRLRLVPRAQRRRTLVDATLAENGDLDLTFTQDGAALLPFTGIPGGTRIQDGM